MKTILDYQIIEKITENSKAVVYKGKQENAADTVVIKLLKAENYLPSEIAADKQMYSRLMEMNLDGVESI